MGQTRDYYREENQTGVVSEGEYSCYLRAQHQQWFAASFRLRNSLCILSQNTQSKRTDARTKNQGSAHQTHEQHDKPPGRQTQHI